MLKEAALERERQILEERLYEKRLNLVIRLKGLKETTQEEEGHGKDDWVNPNVELVIEKVKRPEPLPEVEDEQMKEEQEETKPKEFIEEFKEPLSVTGGGAEEFPTKGNTPSEQ
jgi:hypothetical protein